MIEPMTRNLADLLDAYRQFAEAARAVGRTHGVLRCGTNGDEDETAALRNASFVLDRTKGAVAAKFDEIERAQLLGYFGLTSRFGSKRNIAATERLTERGYFRLVGKSFEITASGIEAAVAMWASR